MIIRLVLSLFVVSFLLFTLRGAEMLSALFSHRSSLFSPTVCRQLDRKKRLLILLSVALVCDHHHSLRLLHLLLGDLLHNLWSNLGGLFFLIRLRLLKILKFLTVILLFGAAKLVKRGFLHIKMSLTVAMRVTVGVGPAGQSAALLHRPNATHWGRLLLLDRQKLMDILTRLICTFLKVLLV